MEKEIKITKVKLKKDGSMIINYDELIGDPDPAVNHLLLESGYKAHEDLVARMKDLDMHLMLICEQAKTDTSNVLNSITVTGYSIGGDEDNKGVTLIGMRTLASGKVLNLVAPFTKFFDENPEYKKQVDLAADLQLVDNEVLLYMNGSDEWPNGKHAPEMVQSEMEFGEEESGSGEDIN